MSMCMRKHVGEYAMGVSILRAALYSAEVRNHLGISWSCLPLYRVLFLSFSLLPFLGPSWGPLDALLGSSLPLVAESVAFYVGS